MANTEENLETLQKLCKMLAIIAKNQVNIAIFVALIQTMRDSELTIEQVIKQIRETFGDSSFGEDEIRDRLNRLVSRGWIEKIYRDPCIIAPRYEYNLSVDGQIIAKFFKEMIDNLNSNAPKEA